MYKHLTPYTRPRDYAGPDHYGWYPVLGQHRESDVITRSNFRVALERLGGESDTVKVVRDAHWAVGWVETLYVSADDAERCARAEAMLAEIDAYPALSDEDWTQLEWDEAHDFWEREGVAGRLRWIQDHNARCPKWDTPVSAFAARRLDIPEPLYEAVAR